ncbi:hypothetical protein MGYG_06771 [Nannizzia gypsea CBS 118893]|uniref:DSC E3 ubiquitin ligase complex subunit 2 n=1 Tax=Arthroderma gypseum (strain ATCC MYA-4604 / CBS 118893) TaxID=535722 RepID=E4V156_ARTGP|nr:hypothetical protein MGYG_06771 [Nannizzia gypsea CBS 118893]EFR03771.1 hypothetical protein MGYG_06771 [Nannizzia gypsea CBS 118893]
MLSSGFTNAPVTKLALVFIIASSIIVSIADAKYLFYIQVNPHIWQYNQLWRFLIWPLCYTNSTEVLLAGMVIYTLRVIERLWGSRKFASFIISTLPLTTILPPLVLTLIARPLSLNTLNHLPAGPTAILFAILAQYHATIPTTYKYRLLTSSSGASGSAITFSDKSTIYFLALQLSLSQLPHTILPAFVGWVIGYAWRAELLPSKISSWRIPGWLYGGSSEHQRLRGASRNRGDGDASSSGTAGAGNRDPERLEGLRRRLEGESRAAAVAVANTDTDGGRRSSSSAGGGAGGVQEADQRRPLAGQILDRFRGTF